MKYPINIDNLHEHTAQEVFDQIVNHLYTQGVPSITEGPLAVCKYRGPNGLMCAAGIFLSDEQAERFENRPWVYVANGLEKGSHSELIRHCQSAHDDAAPYFKNRPVQYLEVLSDGLRSIAQEHELKLQITTKKV